MPGILSAEHCARVSSWDESRQKSQKSKKISNRAKLIGFILFNVAIWSLFLAPVLFR